MNDGLQTVRWGIMGTARIATRVSRAIHAVEGAEASVIASRSSERADSWGSEHDIPHSLEGYQALLDDETLDAIYIPLPPPCTTSGRSRQRSLASTCCVKNRSP